MWPLVVGKRILLPITTTKKERKPQQPWKPSLGVDLSCINLPNNLKNLDYESSYLSCINLTWSLSQPLAVSYLARAPNLSF